MKLPIDKCIMDTKKFFTNTLTIFTSLSHGSDPWVWVLEVKSGILGSKPSILTPYLVPRLFTMAIKSHRGSGQLHYYYHHFHLKIKSFCCTVLTSVLYHEMLLSQLKEN